MKRVGTALVLAALALFTIYRGHPAFFFAVVAVMATSCYIEYVKIAQGHGHPASARTGIISGLVILWKPDLWPLLPVVSLAQALRMASLKDSLPYGSTLLLGVIYIYGSWRCAFDLQALNPHWLLFALAINWVGDVAALYTGRSLGRHKLAPIVSPGKSWEGAAGSMFACVAFGILFGRTLMPEVAVWKLLLLAIAANVAGQAGDLAESALKRGAGVKDSGALLPGHGGFLDRLDSSLFSMPVVLFLLRALG